MGTYGPGLERDLKLEGTPTRRLAALGDQPPRCMAPTSMKPDLYRCTASSKARVRPAGGHSDVSPRLASRLYALP